MKIKYLLSYLFCALLVLSSCSKDDSYEFPSVKLDYLTVQTGSSAEIVKAQTDDYSVYDVSEAKKSPDFKPLLFYRVLANYQLLEKEGKKEMKIYGYSPVFSSAPIKVTEAFPEDPVEVSAIWPGALFLNLTLYVKTSGVAHVFGVVEESAEQKGETCEVHLRLMHDAKNNKPDYRKRYYCSFPLSAYAKGVKHLKVYLKLNSYSEGMKEYVLNYNLPSE